MEAAQVILNQKRVMDGREPLWIRHPGPREHCYERLDEPGTNSQPSFEVSWKVGCAGCAEILERASHGGCGTEEILLLNAPENTKKNDIIQGCRLYWRCGWMSVDGTLCSNWQHWSPDCQQLVIRQGKMVGVECHGCGIPDSL